MSDAALPVIPILASVPAGVASAATAVVEAYAAELCAGLAIPAVPRVEFVESPVDRFTIGGESVAAAVDRTAEPAEVPGRLCDSICRGRECLVTGEVAGLLWADWGLEASGTSFGDFRAMLRQAVRSGHRVDSMRDAFRDVADPSDVPSVATRFERVFSGSVPGVRLRISAADFSRSFDSQGAPRPLPGESRNRDELLDQLSRNMFYELGILFKVDVIAGEDLDPDTFRIEWNNVSRPVMRALPEGAFLINETVDALRGKYGVEALPAVNPANGRTVALVSGRPDLRLVCEAAGQDTWGRFGHFLLAVAGEVSANAGAFFSTELLAWYMDQLGLGFPVLVEEATKRFSRDVLAGVMRALLNEGISIRDLRTILEAMLGSVGTTTGGHRLIIFSGKAGVAIPASARRTPADMLPEDLVECARVSLRRYISHKYSRGSASLEVLLLTSELEDLIDDLSGSLPEPAWHAELLQAVRDEIQSARASESPVILTTVEIRRKAHELLRHAFPNLAILSYQELSPDLNIQPLARVGLALTI